MDADKPVISPCRSIMAEAFEQERSYYRLRYPSRERPSLLVGRQRFVVTELSETGLRLLADWRDDELDGILVLRDGTQLPVSGDRIREVDGETVIGRLSGVKFAVLMSEQRRLIGKGYLSF